MIFYVLLELQSTVDHLMPFRLLLYMVEIWRDIYNNTPAGERERKGFRLPAIVPAVLYNGRRSWTACRSFREYQAGHERFPGYLLHPFRRRPLQRRGPVPVGQRGVQRVLPGCDRGRFFDTNLITSGLCLSYAGGSHFFSLQRSKGCPADVFVAG